MGIEPAAMREADPVVELEIMTDGAEKFKIKFLGIVIV